MSRKPLVQIDELRDWSSVCQYISRYESSATCELQCLSLSKLSNTQSQQCWSTKGETSRPATTSGKRSRRRTRGGGCGAVRRTRSWLRELRSRARCYLCVFLWLCMYSNSSVREEFGHPAIWKCSSREAKWRFDTGFSSPNGDLCIPIRAGRGGSAANALVFAGANCCLACGASKRLSQTSRDGSRA